MRTITSLSSPSPISNTKSCSHVNGKDTAPIPQFPSPLPLPAVPREIGMKMERAGSRIRPVREFVDLIFAR